MLLRRSSYTRIPILPGAASKVIRNSSGALPSGHSKAGSGGGASVGDTVGVDVRLAVGLLVGASVGTVVVKFPLTS